MNIYLNRKGIKYLNMSSVTQKTTKTTVVAIEAIEGEIYYSFLLKKLVVRMRTTLHRLICFNDELNPLIELFGKD